MYADFHYPLLHWWNIGKRGLGNQSTQFAVNLEMIMLTRAIISLVFLCRIVLNVHYSFGVKFLYIHPLELP